ncbi:type III secretion system stator protein SctL [Yersinia rohdei]|uniref:type III secretion system stator protein SctL n=1 Tax=Yersinia rohdei TaxID=29485 RepID=UPI0011A8A3F2|nr:type III secretion system stator protein SctL [Yersinia rohdei]
MNLFHLSVEKFEYSLPAGRVIPAARLQQMAQSRDILAEAKVQAAAMRQATEIERDALLAQAQQQADDLLQQARDTIETQVLAQHVGWLVAAEQLESSLVMQAREHILVAIGSVITHWAGQQSVSQILIHRMGAEVAKMAQHNGLVLRVHPQQLPAIAAALGARVQCVADENMAEDQAQLGSPMLQLTLSLQRHLSQLILWLQESPPQQELTHDKCQ